MQQAFEFFRGKQELHGKHAKMADELCSIKNVENNYFKRVIDIYILAAIIGFRYDRKAEIDYSSEDTKSIFPDVILKEKDTLDFLMQMMLILENTKTMTNKEGIMKAFRGAQTKEEYLVYDKMFQDYVRGGIEELYERLIVRKPEPDEEYKDEKTANLMVLLEQLTSKKSYE